jgi:arginase
VTILLNPHDHGAPAGNELSRSWPGLRKLFPKAIEAPAPSRASGGIREGVRNLDAIRSHALALAERLAYAELPVYHLGADCGGELAVVAALNRRCGGRLRVLWFDAHADLNTPESSPSGNFHGMVLRTLIGEGPAALAGLVPVPVPAARIALIGLRDADPAEEEFIARHGIARDHRSLDSGGPFYVHVDYDVLDGARYPDSVYPTPNGMTADELIAALHWVRANREVAGMGLTEYVPRSGDTATLRRLLTEGFAIAPES